MKKAILTNEVEIAFLLISIILPIDGSHAKADVLQVTCIAYLQRQQAMKKIINLGIGLLMMVGCTSSRITTSWKVPGIVPQQYHKIMVLGLVHDKNRALQEDMENHMVGDLRDLGYQAVSSLQEYGPKAFDKMDEATAIAQLKTSGVDAVVTIVLLDKQREHDYVPGQIYYSPYGGYYHDAFWGYRTVLYSRIYEPGYYVVNTKFFWESNLYDMSTQKLIYSVQTESFDPANSETMAHEYGKMIIKNMVQQSVLKDNGAVLVK